MFKRPPFCESGAHWQVENLRQLLRGISCKFATKKVNYKYFFGYFFAKLFALKISIIKENLFHILEGIEKFCYCSKKKFYLLFESRRVNYRRTFFFIIFRQTRTKKTRKLLVRQCQRIFLHDYWLLWKKEKKNQKMKTFLLLAVLFLVVQARAKYKLP